MRLQSIANESARSGRRLVRGENGGSRCRIAPHPAILMLAVLLFPFQVAFGIAPSNQTINNPVTDFNADVQLTVIPGFQNRPYNNPNAGTPVAGTPAPQYYKNAGAAFREGTGSIVMKFEGLNGDYYACVLTADHVVSGLGAHFTDTGASNSIGFGNSIAPAGAPADLYGIVSSITGGSTGREDLAMELVNLGTNPKADLVPNNPKETLTWNNIVPLTPVSLNNGVPAVGTNFTIVGFGLTGTTTDMTSYNLTPASSGTKRFLDGTTIAPVAIAHAPYTYNDVQWNPGFGNGAGTTFRGDSGSPMLVTSTVIDGTTFTYPTMTYTVNGTSYTIAASNISKDADGSGMLFGVHTFGIPNPLVKTATSINGGVALTNADLTWITNSCNTFLTQDTPEPSTWVLFAIGFCGVFVATRRSKSKAGAEGRT
jgi:hypothetical protein